MIRRSSCLIAALLILVPLGAIAVAAPPEDEPPVVKLRLYPRGEPRPALKYQLLPPLPDLRPGNAAVIYGKVTAENMGFFGNQELQDKIDNWRSTPLDKFPRQEAEEVLQGSQFSFLDAAARCELIDWQLPIREGAFWEILLPEIQQTRTFGRMLAAKVRLQVAQGKFDEAVHTLQTGYALGRHVAQAQTLVHGLVGISIAGMMSEQIETLIQRPEAPNLYWALTYLPRPLVSMRSGIEGEWSFLYLSYPELRDLEKKDYSPCRWREVLNHLWTEMMRLNGDPGAMGHAELVNTVLALRGYPLAKRCLIERGYPAAEVEAWPVAKVVLLHTMKTYEEFRDDIFKWFAVPYWQSQEGLRRANDRLREARSREAIPLATLLLPAIAGVCKADARSQRSIAALQVIEAIRLYGADHDGKLPEKLSDITQVPIPNDPTTGQPFIYKRSGDTALLESAGDVGVAMRYEITFAPKGKSK